MHDNDDIQLRIKSDPTLLSIVRAMMDSACTRLGISERETGQIVLAVDEALANVIRHGYKGAADGNIWVSLRKLNGDGRAGVEITICDECPDVDLSKIKGRSLDEVRPGGLGVHIIHSAMDEVSFRSRSDGDGVELNMRKYWRAG